MAHQHQHHQQGRKQSWLSGFFDCCSPFGLACEVCWVPCVTHGRTAHRMSNNGNMDNYSCCNGSCMLYCAATCFGVWCIPTTMQGSNIREKYNVEGSCCGDFCKSWCCPCCAVMQQEKEVDGREALLANSHKQQQAYHSQPGMHYPRH